MASEDDKAIVTRKMDALTDKVLWSPEALEVLLSLQGEELAWTSRIPDTDDENVQKYIWTAYSAVKDYMSGGTYEVSSSTIRDLVLKMARQMSEDSEDGSEAKALASRSGSSSSLSVAFAAGLSGRVMSEVESLLKSLDQYRKITCHYREEDY